MLLALQDTRAFEWGEAASITDGVVVGVPVVLPMLAVASRGWHCFDFVLRDAREIGGEIMIYREDEKYRICGRCLGVDALPLYFD